MPVASETSENLADRDLRRGISNYGLKPKIKEGNGEVQLTMDAPLITKNEKTTFCLRENCFNK